VLNEKNLQGPGEDFPGLFLFFAHFSSEIFKKIGFVDISFRLKTNRAVFFLGYLR